MTENNKIISFYKLGIFLLEKKYKEKGINIQEVYPYLFEPLSQLYVENDVFYLNETVDTLSDLYLSFFSKDEQKDNGIFFTSSKTLINNIIQMLNKDMRPVEDLKILEPSVGTGALILPIIKIIMENSKDKNPIQLINKISHNICCIDINSSAILLTEISILLEILPLVKCAIDIDHRFVIPKLNLIVGDYLLEAKKLDTKFDYVIGNPPYITMYGRRSRGLTEEKRKYYNENFDFVSNKKGNNKFNMMMFFLELGIKSIRNNGILCYILDIAFFEMAYIDIRKYILENCKILSINIDFSEFEGVTSGQFILTLEKEKNFEKCQENHICWHFDNRIRTQKQFILYSEKNQYKYVRPIDKATTVFLDKFSDFPKLKEICPHKELRTCCALTGKTEDFLVRENVDCDCKVVPFLEGSKGVPHSYSEPQAERLIKLDYNLQIKLSNEFKEELQKAGIKNKKRVTLGDTEAYFYPKLFIRQSATRLIATYTENDYAANNSLYILTFHSNEKEKKDLLKYLCGLLNSDILSEYANLTDIIRTGKGKTPQIKISDLLRIPIPINKQYFNNIVTLVDERIATSENSTSTKIEEKINSIVEKIYSI